jgi:GGDEF domain-containing protein
MPIEAAELYGALLLQCIAWAVLMPALVRPGAASWTPRHLCPAARRALGFAVLQACGWLLLWLQAHAWLSLPGEWLRPMGWLLLAALPGGTLLTLLAWRAQTRAELIRQGLLDPLTGLSKRAAFAARAQDMMATARRFDEPLILVLLSPDDLAAAPKPPGLSVGERAPVRFGRALVQQIRQGDVTGRIADTVFGVLMARTNLAYGPSALDARLRQALGQTLDFSAGWAQLRPGDRGLQDLQDRAEAALSEARRSGGRQMRGEAQGLDADQLA